MYRVEKAIEYDLGQRGYMRLPDNEAGARFVSDRGCVWVSGHMVFVKVGERIRAFGEDKAAREGIRLLERQVGIVYDKDGNVYRSGPDWTFPAERMNMGGLR